jgi:hypothetical protein
MDLAQKQKADSWQSFMKGKGAKKKTGFLTGDVGRAFPLFVVCALFGVDAL